MEKNMASLCPRGLHSAIFTSDTQVGFISDANGAGPCLAERIRV